MAKTIAITKGLQCSRDCIFRYSNLGRLDCAREGYNFPAQPHVAAWISDPPLNGDYVPSHIIEVKNCKQFFIY